MAKLEQFFRLDAKALQALASKRGPATKLGWAVQWSIVRMLGTFLAEGRHVVVEHLGAAAVAAALARRGLALQRLLPDVLAFGLGHPGEEREQRGRAAAQALHHGHRENHPLVRDGRLDGAGEVHRLGELRLLLDAGADLLREDRLAARCRQGVELALQLLLFGGHRA
ncbi:DUF4158 domain-containing protein [Nonomuraea rhodomycinica]|uniref:DUF4158 domain-containing protein n=1 Tax=Nonomuraea rhodomycinica TaxID=1712872 RepID=UPI0035E4480A